MGVLSSSHSNDLSSREFTSYLIVGGGRVAGHFSRYFELESIPSQRWARRGLLPDADFSRLNELAANSSHVLLLISDRAIEEFYLAHPVLHTKTVVHFSGSLASPHIAGAHPLMTFANPLASSTKSETFYDLATYQSIPFVVDRGQDPRALLPRLKNPIHFIEPSQKLLYHALCVMGGNFTTLLWEKVFHEFESRLGISKSALLPYLKQVTENLVHAPAGETVLTGPLMRGDHAVVEKHLEQLKNDPFENVYRAFCEAFAHSAKKGPLSEKRA